MDAKPKRLKTRWGRLAVASLLLLAVAGAMPRLVPLVVHRSPPAPRLADAKELVVLTRNSPTTRFLDADGNPVGLESDLVELFAQDLGLPVRWVEADSYREVLPTLLKGGIHFAAAGLSVTPDRARQVAFGPAYMTVKQVLVHTTDAGRQRGLKSVESKRVEAIEGSSGAARLRELSGTLKRLVWKDAPAENPEELLARVADGRTDYAVTGSHIFDVARNFHPNLVQGVALGGKEQLAWAFPPDTEPELLARVDRFFTRIGRDGSLARLVDRYYGHVKRLDRQDLDAFYLAMRTRLPDFRRWFVEAQNLTGIDWRFIAALAFQESKWDPLATSPTGVRGMMMLTGSTADRLGVTDRLDPRQSIRAGARYLRDLRDALPARIAEPDRTWLALAAYNQGLGHLEDARALAARRKLDPDVWMDVRQALPLLARPDVYETLKHGFARGGEAVALTENVRTYYDILARFEPAHRTESPLLTSSALDARQARAAGGNASGAGVPRN
jgi:membrane-bound lytic murein transglycosylase F